MRRASGAALLITGLAGGLAGGAMAHPHHSADQQVMLSLGLTRADLVLALVPGVADGPALVAQLDSDGDGALSQAERDAFQAGLLADLTLLVDGAPAQLSAGALRIPPLEALGAGLAGLRLDLAADLALAIGADHQVMLTVDGDGFGNGWFIQPYFYSDFAAAVEAPRIERPESGNRLEISFRLKAGGS